ncbi:pseudouridine synthase [uncultured Shewanella sp.]|uniref:pseudouridine synthase n=1 Tax=uncultured Shewanella sp. TaxID=173975 RepID=UPI00262F45EB|nr:pseudouridine synthase [uncultured Shewanella sp.]
MAKAPVANKVRLAKYLALTGLCSRRAATRYIRDGLITIDGRPANHIDTVTLMETPGGTDCRETLLFDGIGVEGIEAKQYWMLNKAVGTDCRLLPGDPDSLLHLLPAAPRLYPVGRLDKDSRGLLLLTNDGELTQKLMHPDFGHSKVYHVRVDRAFGDDFLHLMAQGVSYRDVTTLPCEMKRLDDDKFEIVLTQGLNRQIRRMSQALGFKVIDLKRTKIQTLELSTLNEGEMRQLTEPEITKLRSALE